MFVKQSSNPYKIRGKIYKHFYKQNKYQQFAGIFLVKQLMEEKISENVYVQKMGMYININLLFYLLMVKENIKTSQDLKPNQKLLRQE